MPEQPGGMSKHDIPRLWHEGVAPERVAELKALHEEGLLVVWCDIVWDLELDIHHS